ncbi:unnamed protein product [Rotaria sordida]|uniref:non-specific serine/threonine protein kinase n=2 Tax=Rotaria sordida TaxID=392033 RepID=A0A819NQX1_9BILA|nr:unnamed protein product [Rotaria sordida]
MDENILRSRQKVASKSDEKSSDQEKEKMLIKNRKQTGENNDFGDIEKVPSNIENIMEKYFDIFFGEFFLPLVQWLCFCPMVKLVIHGYQVLILCLASPIIVCPSLVNNIAQRINPLRSASRENILQPNWLLVDIGFGSLLFYLQWVFGDLSVVSRWGSNDFPKSITRSNTLWERYIRARISSIKLSNRQIWSAFGIAFLIACIGTFSRFLALPSTSLRKAEDVRCVFFLAIIFICKFLFLLISQRYLTAAVWTVHFGYDNNARPSLDRVASVLADTNADVIGLLETDTAKPFFGNNDLTSYLGEKLHMFIDFDVAQHIGKRGSRSIRGTLLYMAPEILSSHPYDNRVDLWSMGIILYECLFGRSPFVFSSADELVEEIKSNIPIEIPNDTRISSECRNLLEGLLQRDPNRRISFQDFFRHPFIFIDLSFQIIRADDLFQRSITYEQRGDIKKALDYRVRALDEYVAIIKVDEDHDRKRMLRMKVKEGLAAAEILKKRISQMNLNSASTSTTVSSSTENLDLKNNKELFQAYQHCLNGNQLMNIARFSQACEEYQIGLTVMLRAARTETDPVKSKILHDVISFYLNKAEICKDKNEAQQLDIDIEKIKENTALDNTMLNESNFITERQQRASSHQNCCLQ